MITKDKTIVKIKNLCKSFGDLELFKNINLEVKESEIVVLIGFSGCGKSTLLKMIAGLEDLSSGEIEINEICKLGMAFQYSALFDSLTIAENIVFPLVVGENLEKQYTDEELDTLVKERLSLVGLSGIENQYPSELSGGMKKRVSFARAIVDNPGLVLYDEPTAGLDPVISDASTFPAKIFFVFLNSGLFNVTLLALLNALNALVALPVRIWFSDSASILAE